MFEYRRNWSVAMCQFCVHSSLSETAPISHLSANCIWFCTPEILTFSWIRNVLDDRNRNTDTRRLFLWMVRERVRFFQQLEIYCLKNSTNALTFRSRSSWFIRMMSELNWTEPSLIDKSSNRSRSSNNLCFLSGTRTPIVIVVDASWYFCSFFFPPVVFVTHYFNHH